jgi:hypothetical protein
MHRGSSARSSATAIQMLFAHPLRHQRKHTSQIGTKNPQTPFENSPAANTIAGVRPSDLVGRHEVALQRVLWVRDRDAAVGRSPLHVPRVHATNVDGLPLKGDANEPPAIVDGLHVAMVPRSFRPEPSGVIGARLATKGRCTIPPGGRRPSWSGKECFIRPGASVGPTLTLWRY